MKYKVRILRRAQADLSQIHRYVSRDSPDTADQIVERVLGAIDDLDEFPERGTTPRDVRLERLRYLFLVVDPYLIFYKVGRTVVRVYRVLHGRRRYQDIL